MIRRGRTGRRCARFRPRRGPRRAHARAPCLRARSRLREHCRSAQQTSAAGRSRPPPQQSRSATRMRRES